MTAERVEGPHDRLSRTIRRIPVATASRRLECQFWGYHSSLVVSLRLEEGRFSPVLDE